MEWNVDFVMLLFPQAKDNLMRSHGTALPVHILFDLPHAMGFSDGYDFLEAANFQPGTAS